MASAGTSRYQRTGRSALSPISILLVGLLLLLAFTSVLPLVRLFARAFDGDALGWVFQNRQAVRALVNTLRVSLAVALGAGVLGALLTLLLQQFRVPGRNALRLLLLLPLVVPPHILALAWLSWVGPRGLLSRGIAALFGFERVPWTLYGEAGMILLLTVFALPVSFLTISAAFSRLPVSLDEAAQLEGAGPWQVARHVTLPLLAPHVLAGMMLAFLAAAGNFGITALLGIPGRFITLPTLIYQRVTNFSSGGLNQAAAVSLLLVVVALLAMAFQRQTNRRAAQVETQLTPRVLRPLGARGTWLAAFTWVLAAFGAIGPFLALLVTSLSRAYGLPLALDSFDFRHFHFVLTELESFPRALVNSLLLATGASVLAAGLATQLGYVLIKLRRGGAVLQFLVDLPYILPGIVFALALILAWLPSPIPGIRLYGTIWLLGIAYVGHFLAFALQPIQAAWRQLDPRLEEAAQLDGATLLQALRHVLLPILAPTVIVATLLVFLNAVSEISLSSLLAGSGTETLGWLIYGLEQAGTGQPAAALSVVLLLVIGGIGGVGWCVLRFLSHLNRTSRGRTFLRRLSRPPHPPPTCRSSPTR